MPSQRLHEHRRAATRAGLKYVTDGFAGITRKRSGTGWTYFAPNGSRLISGSLDRWLQIWETTPLADRAAARSRQASLVDQAAAAVDTAMAQQRDASLAAALLREDHSLSEELRAAALDDLLRRGASTAAATNTPAVTRPG